ncbi:hypothetical protein [Bailinhaonella thermotolerans]|uniref:Uncharacterized protein n=1 Tax=Bailinhaonella thermotolerans TaxID=1070861 RepID=A0A3A4A462_9ACTN|nr:hypothetical protein [Bailinhaonella thermotolerans]RJL20176.1 hypothetical protein D5H75_39705 [Bailinhaonella thermotolerans]
MTLVVDLVPVIAALDIATSSVRARRMTALLTETTRSGGGRIVVEVIASAPPDSPPASPPDAPPT